MPALENHIACAERAVPNRGRLPEHQLKIVEVC